MSTENRSRAYSILALAGLGVAGVLAASQNSAIGYSLLSDQPYFLSAAAILPFAMAAIAAGGLLFPPSVRPGAIVALNVAFFLFFGRGPAAVLLAFHCALFSLDRYLPRGKIPDRALILLGVAFTLAPFASWCLAPASFNESLPIVALVRDAFSLRTLSWVFHRRLFDRREHEGWLPFLEYLFCPIFFVVPNLLCFVTFSYFHSRRADLPAPKILRAVAISAFGLVAICGYWILEQNWLQPVWRPFLWARAGELDGLLFLAGGFVSHCAILLHHTAYMAFQIGIARLAGWQLRYDMIYPLLARSPMELWSRQHNYVKSYLVEEWIRPGMLTLTRLGFGGRAAIFWSALAGYIFFTAVFSGWRPFEAPRPPLVALAMILFFAIMLATALLLRERPGRFFMILRGNQPLEPLRSWHWYDFLLVLATLALVSAAKAGMGYMRVLDPGP